MSLTAALQIARSALTTSQIGLQVAGNNLANATTPGYTRQVAMLNAIAGTKSDPFRIGRGVGVEGVQRKIDEALQSRLRASISDEFRAAELTGVFDQLEGILNELTENDLSSQLSSFFNVWSEATNLIDSASVVVQQGDQLAAAMQRLRHDLTGLRSQIENQIDANVQRADALLDEIATINGTITNAEVGQAQANALRDERERLIQELSSLIDVTTVEDSLGSVDVLVGSTPVVLGAQSRGLDVRRETVEGVLEVRVIVESSQDPLPVTGGSIGGLISSRDGTIDGVIEELDELAAQMIFEVNKLHATGANKEGLLATHSTLQLPVADRTLAFNDPNNNTLSNLPFAAVNGGFEVHVRNPTTGASDVVRIDIDLDGIDGTGQPGFDDDTTPEELRAALDAVDGISASWSPDGSLNIEAEQGFEFNFADDTSGVLGVLGVNAFFDGTNAADIGVRQELLDNPSGLMLGRFVDGEFVENGNALAIAGVRDVTLTALGGRTIESAWQDRVRNVSGKAATAKTDAAATQIVRESLEAQRGAVSGVSIDEESIDLLNYQRQYQGAARLITIADELLQELIALV